MGKDKKDLLLEEQLRKFKYRVNYVVNESPRYRPLVGTDEEFDNMPMTNEAGEQEDAPKPEGEMPTETTIDQPMNTGAPEGMPTEIPSDTPPGEEPPIDGMGGDAMGDPMAMGTNPGQEVDSIQNEIIKHNIAAMQSIHDKLQGLDATVQGLNTKLDSLNAEVEEVREPTNSEKLMSKTNVSYPYYFNLNDFWSGNWFDKKRDEAKEEGVRELPDGSFIADFDDLPQKSKMDVQNSFNEFNESVKRKSNLKESYDEDYWQNMPDDKGGFHADDIRMVKELFILLSQDGIEDINDSYPAWVIKSLSDEGYIEENPQSYLWFFTPEGREYLETPNDLQEFLMGIGGYNVNESVKKKV